MSTDKQRTANSADHPARKFSKAKPLAAQLGLCPKTIFRLADAGHFNRYQINPRVVLFDHDEVVRFVESARLETKSA